MDERKDAEKNDTCVVVSWLISIKKLKTSQLTVLKCGHLQIKKKDTTRTLELRFIRSRLQVTPHFCSARVGIPLGVFNVIVSRCVIHSLPLAN